MGKQGEEEGVESRNFDIRKQLLEFDNVANEQRKILYQQRNEVLESNSLSDLVGSLRRGTIEATVRNYIPQESIEEQWDLPALEQELKKYSLEMDLRDMVDKKEELGEEDLLEEVCKNFTNIAPIPGFLYTHHSHIWSPFIIGILGLS